MSEVGIRELLEAGVHFGHQTRRWNPKMRRFIHGERAGIYIIDLLKTARLLGNAQEFATGIAQRGGTILFVGTKKQARDAIAEVADASGMPYVNHRWLGGLLTNWNTIQLRIKRLHDLERYSTEGQLQLLPTRERMSAEADLLKLQANLGGVKNMQRPPDALFVIDLKTEAIAVREAQRLRIPIIGLVDTNCDPDGIDYVIPGNDDAMRSCRLITQAIGDVVASGRGAWQAMEEERIRREAEERARREEEERMRREEEEARRVSEEAAAAQAAAEAAAGSSETQAAAAQAAAEAAAPPPPAEEPAKPEPAKPAPAKPAPAKPEPAKPEPAKPEPAKPEPAKPAAAAAPEPAKPAEPAPEPAKPAEPAPEPAPEPAAPEPAPEPAAPAAEAAEPAEPAEEKPADPVKTEE